MQQSEVVCNLSAGTELVTAWLLWFLDCLGRAIHGTGTSLGGILDKARFWENFAAFTLNERQRNILKRLLDGFDGKLTTSKRAEITKSSQDTAIRDLKDPVEKRIPIPSGEGGRRTSYALEAP